MSNGTTYRYSRCCHCREEIRGEWPYRAGEWMDRETGRTCDLDGNPAHEPDETWRTEPDDAEMSPQQKAVADRFRRLFISRRPRSAWQR